MSALPHIPKQTYVQQVKKIVDYGRRQGVVLRSMGSVAVALHSPRFSHLQEDLGREITDLDIMAYSKQWRKVMKVLEENGFRTEKRLSYSDALRRCFKLENMKVDVFFDKIDFCHTIDLTQRLQVDDWTLSLADLFLEKMQIVKINEKDIIDTIVLVLEHEVGKGDAETINSEYVARLLAKDWGFSYTVTNNLRKIKENFVERYSVLSNAEKEQLTKRIDHILDEIGSADKSMTWKMRARIGTRQRWYKEVFDFHDLG